MTLRLSFTRKGTHSATGRRRPRARTVCTRPRQLVSLTMRLKRDPECMGGPYRRPSKGLESMISTHRVQKDKPACRALVRRRKHLWSCFLSRTSNTIASPEHRCPWQRRVCPRLLAVAVSPGRKRVATDPPEPSSKVIPSRKDSPQVVAVPRRDFGKMPSSTLYTVGYGGIPEPEEMTALLREHGVEVLVDIRVRPFGHKVLFNKKKLEDPYGPVKSAGLDYLHIVELGNEGKGTGNLTQGSGKKD